MATILGEHSQARFANAISKRNKKEISELAKAKADLNVVSSFGSTPLMLGVIGMCALNATRPAKIKPDACMFTPFFLMQVMTADPSIVTILLELGADPQIQVLITFSGREAYVFFRNAHPALFYSPMASFDI